MGILPAIPMCGGFPLLADSRHSSFTSSNILILILRLGMLCSALPTATAASQGKRPHQIDAIVLSSLWPAG